MAEKAEYAKQIVKKSNPPSNMRYSIKSLDIIKIKLNFNSSSLFLEATRNA